ncbi:MAG: hypothetical protein AB1942_21120 [Pseudomonadota bacterium]
MAVGRFSDTNLLREATLSGGGWLPGHPLANLKVDQDYIGAPARCADLADLSKSRFEVSFAEPTVVSFMALLFHTLTVGARYRLRATTADDVAFETPLLNTGWQYVYPSIYDPMDLDFGVENFFSGTLSAAERALYPPHLWIPFAEVLADRLLIELDDQENAAGFIDIGGAYLTAGFSPDINYDRGRDLNIESRSLLDEGASGQVFAEARQARRLLTVSYSNLKDDELRRFVDAAMRADTVRTVIFVPDSDDPGSLLREAYPATFKDPPGARTTYRAQGATTFTLKEILA